ncbi:zinc finger protein 1-like [Solanum pennellii]|uniref:Zinc finger protein 1-like n=1 Tax=Solanum pennellii TaxID=28526 RepID=A0ABM1UZ46_SOLPN|nr:zinc finger protein 1-like [Solanum pennellii]
MDAFAMKKSCSSKDSSKSPALEESHEVITNTKKMKEISMEDSQLKTHELSCGRTLLHLKVRNNDGNINCSNLGLNLLNSTPNHAIESSNEATHTQRHSAKTKIFSCNFCRKEFSTKQALGGHQNGHKQERALSKRKKKLVDVVQPFDPPNYHPYYSPYSNLNSHMPFHSSFTNQSPFGVNGDSYVIHNPTFYQTWPCFSRYNYQFNPVKWSSSSLFFSTKNLLGNKNNDMIGTRVDASENSLNSESKNSAKGLDLKDSPINIDDNLDGNSYMQMKLEEADAEKNNEEDEELDLDLKL